MGVEITRVRRKRGEWWRAALLLAIVCWGSLAVVLAQERWYTIQIASVVSEEEARGLLRMMRAKGIAAYAVRAEVPGLGLRYRIRYGRFRTSALARGEAEREIGRGTYQDFIISREEPETVARRINEAPPKSTSESPPAAATKMDERPQRNVERLPAKVQAAPPAPAGQNSPPAQAALAPQPAPPQAAPLVTLARPAAPRRVATPRVRPALPELIVARNSWEAIVPESLPEERWVALQFIDGLTGWIGGESGSIYRTNDGGRTWRAVATEAGGRIISLSFADWNCGWVLVEGAVLVTKNGGRSWRRQPLEGAERLVRIDRERGWALGRGARLMRTIDGGETWSRAGEPFSAGQPDQGLQLELVDLTSAVDNGSEGERKGSGRLWMVANLTPGERAGAEASRFGGIWRADAGGQGWSRVAMPDELTKRSGRFLSIRFQSELSGTITGELVQGEARSWFILATADGGVSWKLEVQPGRELAQARFTTGSEIAQTGFGGRGSGLGGTLPSGHGWTQTATIEADQSGNSSHIESHLLVTRDGGRSWTEEFRLIGRHSLLASFIRENQCWVLTDRGVLLIGRPN